MLTAHYRSPRRESIQLTTFLAVAAGLLLTRPAAAAGYQVANLVSDLPNTAAQLNSSLVNPWGLAHGPTGPMWVANNETGVATGVLAGDLSIQAITITGAVNPTDPSRPTGIVYNDSTGFLLSSGSPARFLTATEDGTIVGWDPAARTAPAQMLVNNTGSALYTGLSIANGRLYACNFRQRRIDVFNSDFTPAGSVMDTTLPDVYAPFNIQNLGGTLYVTFAEQNDTQDGPRTGTGRGFVDTFDPASGMFRLLISRGALDTPWGMALAPANFGLLSNSLLIGNFGDGIIHAFNPATGIFLDQLRKPDGNILTLSGLWGLSFGNDEAAGPRDTLYWTAGVDSQHHGVFGSLQFVP
jgi:uncharacterized protein (TIGR03118 family)